MTTRATAEPKETVTYETREAIMGCGCRIVMDAATFDSEGAHCAVHDNTEVVRVIKVAPMRSKPRRPTRPSRAGATRTTTTRSARAVAADAGGSDELLRPARRRLRGGYGGGQGGTYGSNSRRPTPR